MSAEQDKPSRSTPKGAASKSENSKDVSGLGEGADARKDDGDARASDKKLASDKKSKAKANEKSKAGNKPNNVRALRIERMMSKAELARRANLSVLTVDRVEKGFGCRMDTKRKILKALDLNLADRVRVFGEEE